jgi:hypothetical protein
MVKGETKASKFIDASVVHCLPKYINSSQAPNVYAEMKTVGVRASPITHAPRTLTSSHSHLLLVRARVCPARSARANPSGVRSGHPPPPC